ncbi:hypothetical protein HMJ29_13955 [Hymenobacter taeanensis]|uniref:STAS/SEC14 domain-containing protein n=1 Tax=Hymenobacter taeanensis TaxID=2735321 RepID=A0A6M6BIY4_9BACT|nr:MULTISPECIES: hypothetical protein [Hymenobacter]QJX47982.1 hypothetical protein HMJ29_13955 [Hymenobacter taeanensis]UOQ82570.1 hypothetical protein MUN83_07345 [Hymenobacter sp. 5414T-23]
MMPLLYFENAMGRILEHPNGYVLIRYHPGKRSLVDLQEFLTHVGRLLQLRNWHKLLSDQRLLSPLTEEEQALILDYWQARHFTFGATDGAVLLSHNVHSQRTFAHFRDQTHGSLRYRQFENELDADAWLRQL